MGEIGGNYATLCNISQSKKGKEAGTNKIGRELGLKGLREAGSLHPECKLLPLPPQYCTSCTGAGES